MAVPDQVDDGDFRSEIEMSRDVSFPLSNRNDFEHFVYRVKYSRDKNAFRKSSAMSTFNFPLGKAYLVEHSDADDVGYGICEYEKVYASIPKKRTEVQVMSFNFAIIAVVGLTQVRTDYTLTNTADVVYEYFDKKPKAILAPRFYYVKPPDRLVCQDSDIDIYMGGIWQRKSYYADAVGSKLNI